MSMTEVNAKTKEFSEWLINLWDGIDKFETCIQDGVNTAIIDDLEKISGKLVRDMTAARMRGVWLIDRIRTTDKHSYE